MINSSVEEFFGTLFNCGDIWHWKNGGLALFGSFLYSRDEQTRWTGKDLAKNIWTQSHSQTKPAGQHSRWCFVHNVYVVRGVARINLCGFFWLAHEFLQQFARLYSIQQMYYSIRHTTTSSGYYDYTKSVVHTHRVSLLRTDNRTSIMSLTTRKLIGGRRSVL